MRLELLGEFEAGSGIFDRVIDDPACYPPLDDGESQREWLSGFVAAWSAWPACPGLDTTPDPRHGTLSDVLARALKDRPAVLAQLQRHLVEPRASDQPPDRS